MSSPTYLIDDYFVKSYLRPFFLSLISPYLIKQDANLEWIKTQIADLEEKGKRESKSSCNAK